MPTEEMRLERIRYNPELCGFEALARFRSEAEVTTYPVFLPAPFNGEYRLVMRGLAHKAWTAHDAKQKGLVMRRPTRSAAHPGTAAQTAMLLMRRLLGQRAA